MIFWVRYFFCILLLIVIGHASCHAQATPSATSDHLAAVDALKVAVCVDVEAPDAIKTVITETIVRFLQTDDDVKITDDQTSAFVVFHVEITESGSSGYAAYIVAASHNPIDTLLNNINDAEDLRKEYQDVETLEWKNLYVASTVEDLCKQFLSDIQFNSLLDIQEGKKQLKDLTRNHWHK